MKNALQKLLLAALLSAANPNLHAQGTAFSYQGRLNNHGSVNREALIQDGGAGHTSWLSGAFSGNCNFDPGAGTDLRTGTAAAFLCKFIPWPW